MQHFHSVCGGVVTHRDSPLSIYLLAVRGPEPSESMPDLRSQSELHQSNFLNVLVVFEVT